MSSKSPSQDSSAAPGDPVRARERSSSDDHANEYDPDDRRVEEANDGTDTELDDDDDGNITPIATPGSLLSNGLHLDEELRRASSEDRRLSNGIDNLQDDDKAQHDDNESNDSSIREAQLEEATLPPSSSPPLPSRPIDHDQSSISGPDDLPSSHTSLPSSPPSSQPASRASSRLGSSPAPPAFDRRLYARVPSTSSVARVAYPAFLTARSRQSSSASQLSISSKAKSEAESEPEMQAPWEVVRWNRLKRITNQAFSEAGRRAFGRPTFLTIGASIALGTAKGLVLLFDYQQNLKHVIGQGTLAAESGPVTSLAISADHSAVASGHANGAIFTWDLSGPAKPFLHVPPVDRSKPKQRGTDGHMLNSAVIHIGFLGQRHTALVSADDKGMAFSHLAGRGLGPIGRSVKTTRILGRYPDAQAATAAPKPPKPSSVLAFSPLPLGNVQQSTDDVGLTALLTPYLLVIVSTTPVAQTHFKAPRFKDLAPHGAMTGCLAWFPAVKLNNVSAEQTRTSSNTKLVYCWSNALSLLEVEPVRNQNRSDPTARPDLSFKPAGRWNCDEAILAVQWLSRSIIAVLTITQRLILLNDNPLRQSDSSDLNSRHIYHQDIFSQQLSALVDKEEHADASMHGVVADAYHMSFKAYKGRLFLLGVNELSMGTLSNWADRLMAYMEAGNPIAAIELSTAYYNGETDKVSVGLPENDDKRHALVKPKLLELLSASYQYIFNDEGRREVETDLRSVLTQLAKVSFAACISINEPSFLFDEAYDWFAGDAMQDIFLYELEPYIIQGKIDLVPTQVLQEMLNWYSTFGLGTRLEEILCALRTETMDIDHVSAVCKQMDLYDALISVWNRHLQDYVTPLINLMSIAKRPESGDDSSDGDSSDHQDSAMKLFPYLAYSLTSRAYPDGSDMNASNAFKAKATLYGFIFAPTEIQWPESHGDMVSFSDSEEDDGSASYPYLRTLLRYNPLSFMVLLNEVFEDGFLNSSQNLVEVGLDPVDLGEVGTSGTYINRQRIVNILLEVVKLPDFGIEDVTYLDMFLARSLPKFSQFILLSGGILRQILIELCINPREGLREECQLSVEYLLSVFHPSDLLDLVPMFVKAGYFRIVKSTYRNRKQYANWLEAHFEDPDKGEAVFDCIGDCLRPGSGLSKRQLDEVKLVLRERLAELSRNDVSRSATSLAAYAPEFLEPALRELKPASEDAFLFLGAILEPTSQQQESESQEVKSFRESNRDLYVRLMCKHDPTHVADYVGLLDSGDLHLDKVLPTMDDSGVVDAAVILLTVDGMATEAMDRLMKHLATLGEALVGLEETWEEEQTSRSIQENVAQVIESIQNYAKIGIWLCQQSAVEQGTGLSPKSKPPRLPTQATEETLTASELLWLDLIDTVVKLSQESTNQSILDVDNNGSNENMRSTAAAAALRQTVQTVFTSLLAISINSETASQSRPKASPGTVPPIRLVQNSGAGSKVRFLAVLVCFMARLAQRSSSISSVRAILNSIFSAYVFESSMLELANGLLDKDVFVHVADADAKRRRGWRPKGQLCESCKRRAWGGGAGGNIWDEWVSAKVEQAKHHESLLAARRDGRDTHDGKTHGSDKGKGKGKGKGKDKEEVDSATVLESNLATTVDVAALEKDALIVFSCRHIFHRRCLERTGKGVGEGDGNGQPQYQCTVCM